MASTEKALSVDELLSQQRLQQNELRATIEPTEDPSLVKLNPDVEGSRCLCDAGIKIPKSIIENTVPTGETRLCCGKRLMIVEVRFKDGASIPLREVIEQLKPLSAQERKGGLGYPSTALSAPQHDQVQLWNGSPFPSAVARPMAGCYGCSPNNRCYRQCWDANGNWYWQYDHVCC